MTRTKKPNPDFEIYLRGRYPEEVPVRAIADLVAALRGLVGGHSSEDEIDDEDGINLLDIQRGSARFRCVAEKPHLVVSRLSEIGRLLKDEQFDEHLGDGLPYLHKISSTARKSACDIIIRNRVNGHYNSLAVFTEQTYADLCKKHTITGETELTVTLERVGGATGSKCMVRIPGQNRALFCSVPKKMARVMGSHLYEDISITGEATWLKSPRRYLNFVIRSFTPHQGSIFSQARERLRRAGADRWDHLPDDFAIVTQPEKTE